jgi:molybdopterin/thiamine biosynthesis adenylyltransferase
LTFNRPWWERHRQVLDEEESELRDLADDGEIVLDEELLLRDQIRQYTLVHTCKGLTLDLTVTFSDQHPYFRPEVAATQKTGVHQNPFNGQLCLLEGDTWNWDQSQTVAAMIREQLPQLLEDRPSPPGDEGASEPADSGHVEPYVGYFVYAEGTAVRMGETTAALAGVNGGTMTVVLDQAGLPEVMRGTITEICDPRGQVLWSAPTTVVERYSQGLHPRIEVPWVRLSEVPEDSTAEAVLEAVQDAERTNIVRWQQVGAGTDLSVVAAVFEDGIRPFERGDAWLFVVRGRKPAPRQTGRVKPPRPTVGPYLARAFRSDRRSMTERVPSLAGLSAKKVVLFGAGGVGGPLAIEFAKAGTGTLVIVDKDAVDPGIAARWPLGFQYAGHGKAPGLADFIRWQWPHTVVVQVSGHVGRPRMDGGGDPQWKSMDELLQDVDLVVDCTAEIGVTYYLSDLTREMGLPLVIASTTEGGWGGRVIHLGTDDDAPCWYCIEAHTEDGTLPTPPSDPDVARANVHPAGCTTTTFTATGFDIATVSLGAMRLAAALLASGGDDGYPRADWNVAIYSFRDAATAAPGSAEPFLVRRHPGCESCKNRSSG